MPVPTFARDQALPLAQAMHRAGDVAGAEGIYRQLLDVHPNDADVLESLGVLLLQTGRLESAGAFLRRSAQSPAPKASRHVNLAEYYRRSGQYESAIASLNQALALAPNLAVAHNNLGITLAESGESAAAVAAYQRAIGLKPDYAEAHANLANALSDAQQFDAAVASAARAVALSPRFAAGHNSLGVALAGLARFDEAAVAYHGAIALDPRYADAWSNLGNALAQSGQFAEALTALRRAVEIDPAAIQPHWNYAVELLRAGDFKRGWVEYEWRWKKQDKFPRPAQRFHPTRFEGPHWVGGPLAGKSILLHAEQGFGDAIHFVRYAPRVAALGVRVVVEAHGELKRLFESVAGVEQVIARGETVPPVEAHCPLMSLPLAFGSELHSIPAPMPYLRATPADIQRWRDRLAVEQRISGRSLRVGLCWAGSPKHSDDADRSIPLQAFAAIAQDRVVFISLQKGPAAEQASNPPAGMRLIDLTPDLTDFADTAGLIANLDLVISVDTAVAHLAGALGKPVWVLLRRVPDWRWLIDRRDTPWYPTMTLFRQCRRGEWGQVIEEVSQQLDRWHEAGTKECNEV